MAIKAVWKLTINFLLRAPGVRRQMPRSLNPPNGACIVNLYYEGYYKKKILHKKGPD